MAKKRLLRILVFSAFFIVALDLFHLLFHLTQEPGLWKLEGIRSKIMTKLIPFPLYAGRSDDCRQARELLDQSGTARDAKETLFGDIKKMPPYGSFSSESDQITWWGVFEPFEVWNNPEFQAAWINPRGEEVARQNFHGSHCRLAKTTLSAQNQPRGMFEGGMWQVMVTCQDYLIDKQTFAVVPEGGNPQQKGSDTARSPSETAMIWAEDSVKGK